MKRAGAILDEARNLESRLFVVDAGLDAEALRAKYPDRSKYAIVRGQFRPSIRMANSTRTHAGHVEEVSVDAINVPLELRGAFEGAMPRMQVPASKAKFEATVAFGRRLEPWIQDAVRK